MDWLLDPLRGGIQQRALLELVVLGLACGPLGAWVLLFRQAYAAESLSHAMLPGLVLAALAGAPLVLGALGGVLAGAVCIVLARDERLGTDAAVGVAVSALFGLGALLALSADAPPRLSELLFGDLLGVSGADLAVGAGLVALVVGALAVAHRSFALATFDAPSAPSLGTRPRAAELALLALLGVTVVAAVQGLGNLLVVALVLAPGAAALRFAGRLGPALVLAAALAVLSGVAGLYASFHLDTAAGASVALCALGVFALSLVVRPGR